MKLRIRRSGRKQGADQQEHGGAFAAAGELGIAEAAYAELASGRCRGVTYRRQPCTLDAGPDGYCVFHKPAGQSDAVG